QTADVSIASHSMRRLALLHGVIAFVFNTTLLALTVNIAAGLICPARTPLAHGAWLDHEPAWLPDADATLAALREELRFEQRAIVLFGRPVLQPRLIAWGGELPYRYSGQTLEPRPFTPALARVLPAVAERAGVAFNHVLVNRYREGGDSRGLHADDETELGPDPVVATLSLGATRRLVVKPRRKSEPAVPPLDLEHGSLLIMGGACPGHYVHGVPRQPRVQDERISLTFRRLVGTPRC